MLQNKHYDFSDLGINNRFKLIGSVTTIKNETLPIVFLIDEEHNNKHLIDINIKNAIELISKAKVELVGVESRSGGTFWDETSLEYAEGEIDEGMVTSDFSQFENGFGDLYHRYIVGVESWGISSKIERDLRTQNSPHFGKSVTEHPLNKERSKHFIKTLFELKNKRNISGNLILNCGRDHNTHIEEWIKNGEIEEIAKCKAHYIRLNAF